MNTSGDAAEQMVRLSLEGMEVVLKLSGSAAKNIGALLYVLLKDADKNKTKGKARLTSMLKSGKPLTVFTIKNEELKAFAREAKKYGVVYCVLRNSKGAPDEMCDLMVRSEDAGKINRIVERFQFGAVDKTSIETEVLKGKEKAAPVREQSETGENEQLLDALLSKTVKQEEPVQENPSAAKTVKNPPSEHTSKSPEKSAEGTIKLMERPSVRKELAEIRAVRKAEVEKVKAPAERQQGQKKKQGKSMAHKQPERIRKKNRRRER